MEWCVSTETIFTMRWSMRHRSLFPGVTLHNLQLRVEALEYLQLPVTIKEGYIGRLSLQVPLRALYSRPIVISIHDLVLHVGPRPDEEWHPELAAQRAAAAKQVWLSQCHASHTASTHPVCRPCLQPMRHRALRRSWIAMATRVAWRVKDLTRGQRLDGLPC